MFLSPSSAYPNPRAYTMHYPYFSDAALNGFNVAKLAANHKSPFSIAVHADVWICSWNHSYPSNSMADTKPVCRIPGGSNKIFPASKVPIFY